jgi:hypothetical protein
MTKPTEGRSISAEQKKAMLAAELAGQPAIAAENDNGAGAAPRVAVNATGTFDQKLTQRIEDVRRDEQQEHALDQEIEQLQKQLRMAKVRKATQPGARKLKGNQEISERNNKLAVRDTLIGDKSRGEIIRYTNIEYEPN